MGRVYVQRVPIVWWGFFYVEKQKRKGDFKLFTRFIVVLAVMLGCAPVYGIKMLYPGDMVKGKMATCTYFCYSEEEQRRVETAFQQSELREQLIINKDKEIELLRFALEAQKGAYTETKAQIALLKELFDKSTEREKKYSEIVSKKNDSLAKSRSRERMKYLEGIFTSIISVIGGKALVK
jgi:hypothetical protein